MEAEKEENIMGLGGGISSVLAFSCDYTDLCQGIKLCAAGAWWEYLPGSKEALNHQVLYSV